ncbi:hypothetical protein SODALDRAFT_286833 [Sodiomyces alkalinus F11]|uniref:Uncharacterized protein n=1 Tax=Sodiomyces alkalinus (strain CBS 110278 / VKM F-3762 / F11) TaxID=1314773 RepID=A0A3N2Q553_SODAK|nr:hypothetical protein SODALDRAFT_286833 [Sodiomyces alkalinus F11]ROT41904.1 hypothetical protein SODALDRAFT_286833 [Sodiomyces alkalinus F11]
MGILIHIPSYILIVEFAVAAIARLTNALPLLHARTYRKSRLTAPFLYPIVPFQDDVPKHMRYVGAWMLLTSIMLACPATRGSIVTLGLVLFWTATGAWSQARLGMTCRVPIMNTCLAICVYLTEREGPKRTLSFLQLPSCTQMPVAWYPSIIYQNISSAIMVTTRSSDVRDKAQDTKEGLEGEESPVVGEKHDLEHKKPASLSAKRAKTTTKSSKSHQPKVEEEPPESQRTDGARQPEKDGTSEPGTQEDTKAEQSATATAEKPHQDPDVPSNILEKGIVYVFFRPRVNITDPESVEDVARTYLLLRPIAPDARLGEGPIGDHGNSRLFVVPKKALPKSAGERLMVFVDMAQVSFQQLKDDFLKGTEYETKTRGTSHVPPATPAAEGVYAITSTGRESHLVYMLTLPEELGEVQEELGLKKEGSFIVSTKNPSYPGPANAQLPKKPEFSQGIMDEFAKKRWIPSKPAHFDFVNAQLLLVGEHGVEKATEPQKDDEADGKEEPKEVLEEFEDEDVKRMEGLGADISKAIFADLKARAEEYPKLKTTF